jgi:alpha-D-xyloside xylohydrolase
MKFSNGNWLNREGVEPYTPAEAYEVKIDNNSVTILAPHKHIAHRGDTLAGPVLTIKLSSPMPDVIKVQMWHFKGVNKKGPEFQINSNPNTDVNIVNNDEAVSLTSRNLSVRVKKNGGWSMSFFNGNKRLTTSSFRHAAYIKTRDEGVFMREQLGLSVGEFVYGLGERFTPFIKNGQVVDIWNKDGGTSSEQSYKNIPFYMTNRGYGVFVNHPEEVSYEVGSERVARVQFSVPGEYLEYFIINGPTPKKVLENYTSLTGKPALPPAWSYGLWLTTSFTTNYDEATVSSFVDGMAERDIPLRVFHFDCFWMKEFNWCDFEWDKRVFPEPKNMLTRLKQKGLNICVWINPYIAQESELFDEGMEHGYLIKRPNGDVWQWDLWQPGMGIVDFTNPEACKWFADKLQALIDMGVDCFKTDFGERIPTDVVYYDGSDPIKMHNYYTHMYNKVVFDLLKKNFGENKAVLFARSATVGGQQFPVHWGGDCSADYPSMAESLRGGLSLCMSGFGFWSHDIGGFESTSTADVYKRWAAFGLLSSHSRLHGSSSYRVPWLYDEEAVDVVRFFSKLKCSLMPYIFRNSVETSKTGVPMMRSMVLEFPEDLTAQYLDRQYFLGDSLLVAPIFSEDGNVSYYLPKGKWTNFINNELVDGGCWRNETHSYLSVPLMVKPNSIIAVGNETRKPDYDYTNNVTYHIFQLEAGKEALTTVCNTEGEVEATAKAKQNGNVITIEVSGCNKPYSIVLRGISNIKSISGASTAADGLGTRFVPEGNAKTITVEL